MTDVEAGSRGINMQSGVIELTPGPQRCELEERSRMKWWQASIVMFAETVSLGILSLPAAVAKLGFVPGGLFLLFLGLIAWYTGYALYQFKMENPAVECFADAGALVGGKVGKWIGEVIQMALLVFIMGAHILTFSVMMNTTTIHASCTIWWTLIALGVSIAATLPKTFKTNSYISIFSCMSIIVATFIALVSLAVDKPGLGNSYTFTPLALTSIGQGSVAAGNIVLAFSGHIAYFNIMTEMKNPREFKKALTAAQVTSIVIYLVVGLVIYYYAGQDVASPAINSVRLVVRKASYALATPTIVIAGVITALVASKTMHRHIKQRGPLAKIDEETKGWLSWTVIVVSLWVVAWLIANIIPGFAQLLALIGALFGTWISLGLPAIFWLWMNRRCYGLKWGDRVQKPSKPNWRKKSLAVVNVCILWLCIGMCGAGVYGSGVSMQQRGILGKPFSCADNSL